MFVRYEYKAGAAIANFLSDIILLLTGTTDPAALSADCVQASTTVYNDGSRLAGWEIWDASAGTNTQVLRSLNADGTTYKYIALSYSGGKLYIKCYEGWNPTTHVGTNLCYYSDTAGLQIDLVNGGIFFMSSSPRGAVFQSWLSGVWDAYGPIGVLEHTRDEPWDTVAFGLPPFGWFSSGFFSSNANVGSGAQYGYIKPRRKNSAGTDVTGNQCGYAGLCPYGQGDQGSHIYGTSPTTRVRDVNFNLVHAFCTILLRGMGTANEYNIPGKLNDLFVTTFNVGGNADEATYNGKTYFIFAIGPVRIAVPKF